MVEDTSTVDTTRMLAELHRLTKSVILIRPLVFTVQECEKHIEEARQALVESLTYTEDEWLERCEAYNNAEAQRVAEANAAHRPEFLLYTAMEEFLLEKAAALGPDHEAQDDVALMVRWAKLLANDNVRPDSYKLTWEDMRRITTERAMYALREWESRLESARVVEQEYAIREQRAARLLEVFRVE